MGIKEEEVLKEAGGHADQQGHLGATRNLMAAPEGHAHHAAQRSVHEVTAGL